MQKIIPHLWFDKEAKEAAAFYTSVFPQSAITDTYVLRNTPSGDCDVVSFNLWGYSFMAISAGPLFTFNPSISFMVNFDPSQDPQAKERIDTIWHQLSGGGKILMPIDTYPFSERYGWVQDKYGLSWQLILTNPQGEERPLIIPSLLFTGEVSGKAEAAHDFYLSVFRNAKSGGIVRYGKEQAPEKEGTVMFTSFRLEGQWFAAMDSARQHGFGFNESVSFIVNCSGQQEIDRLWEQLSAVPESEQCGWLKDKFGVSWQIVPAAFEKMMRSSTPEQMDRLSGAFMAMKKFDLAKLEAAYEGKEG
ncbi:VOC family protein [Paraflavisolibacter sp. H34]|uniref:VOC family protein n=1 Tax=Huijunlia imazamoxiresistens TaxID=3127457 RepID=UPI00301A4227